MAVTAENPQVEGQAARGALVMGPWGTVAILLLVNVLGYVDRLIITMMVGPIQSDLQISDVQMGLLMGFAFAVFYASCGIPMGAIVDRVSRVKLLFLGIAGWSAMTFACGLAKSFPQLLLARAGVGLGESPLTPASQSLVAAMFPRERMTLALSVLAIGAVMGAGFAAAIGGTLVHAALQAGDTTVPLLGTVHAWQLVFIWLGIAGVSLSPLMFLIREVRPSRPVGHLGSLVGEGWKEVRAIIAGRPGFFLCYLAAVACISAMINGVTSWSPEYAFRELGQTRASFALPYGIVLAVCGTVGHLISGVIIDRWVVRGVLDAHIRFQVGTMIVGLPLVAAGLLSGSPLGFYLGIAVFFLLITGFTAYMSAALQLATPVHARGKIIAIFALVIALGGQGLGPVGTALVNDYVFSGERLGAAMAVQLVVIGIAAAFFLVKAAGPMRDQVSVFRDA